MSQAANSQAIIGCANGISLKNSTYLLTTTFKRAFIDREQPTGLTFHSDQGAQYTSNTFRKLLRMNNIVQSFSRSGRPQDNAVSEAFFASLKKEEIYWRNYTSESEFRKSIDTYMHFYNTERPHRTLHYKTPEQFEAKYTAG
ncbi:transposase [Dysosmobacter sp.]